MRPDSSLELERAVERGAASFDQVVDALYGGRGAAEATSDVEALDRFLYPKLLDAFEHANGPIESSFYGRCINVGAALTRTPHATRRRGRDADDDPTLHTSVWWNTMPFDAHEARLLFADIQVLSDKLKQFLVRPSSAYAIAVRTLYVIVCDLIASLNCEAAQQAARSVPSAGEQIPRPSDRHLGELADLRLRVRAAHESYERSAQRQAQQKYVRAALLGTLPVIAVVTLFGLASGAWGIDERWVAAAALGAAGAVMSLFTRMSTGRLELNYETRDFVISVLGWLRPLIGVISGVVAYVLIAGGLVAIKPPSGADPSLYYGGIGFVAGFSERLIQDMLVGTTKLITPESDSSTPPAPSSG